MLPVSEARDRIVRIQGYAEGLVYEYSEATFRGHFHISREGFRRVVIVLTPIMTKPFQSVGHPIVEISKQVLIFLWYSVTHDTLNNIADRFSVCPYTVMMIRRRLSRMIYDNLFHKVIKLPTGDKLDVTAERFAQKYKIRGVVGCVDGTHIAIIKPTVHGEQYYNRKDFYSMNTQIVCDDQLLITDMFIGFPGSVHDARVLRNSPVPEYIAPRGFPPINIC